MSYRNILSAGIAAALLVSAVAVGAYSNANAEEKKEDDVKALMTAAHKAPKGKTSPLQKLQAEFKSESPDWKVIVANTKPLATLADAIKDKTFGYRGPTKPYVDAVALLKKSTNNNDIAQGRAAMAAISQSCASCHRP